MATVQSKVWSTTSRTIIVVLAGVLIGWFLVERFWPRSRLVEVVAMPPAVTAPVIPVVPKVVLRESGSTGTVTAPKAEVAAGRSPSFDIVRVGPEGQAIIAGRAQPGAEVVVHDGDAEVARGRADSSGAFVALPSEPLSPGGRELTLTARSGAGGDVKGDGVVLLVVPEVPKARSGVGDSSDPAAPPVAVAVLVPNAAVPRVLQEPSGARIEAAMGLTLDRIDYDEKGAIRFTGGAGPGTTVRLYIDNRVVGDAGLDGAGRWSLVPSMDVSAGVHAVRVDSLGVGGRVVGRLELPFERSLLTASEIAGVGARAVVQPGQSLWRLARAAYGRGVQYTVIYLANREQIRDPRLIYPGQTFAIPGAASAGH